MEEAPHYKLLTLLTLFTSGFWAIVQNVVYTKCSICSRVSHLYTFFELSYTLLTTHALGLYEFTKKISAL